MRTAPAHRRARSAPVSDRVTAHPIPKGSTSERAIHRGVSREMVRDVMIGQQIAAPMGRIRLRSREQPTHMGMAQTA